MVGALLFSSTARIASAFLPAGEAGGRGGVVLQQSGGNSNDKGGEPWWQQYMSVGDGAVTNKGAPDPFERMKKRPPRTAQGSAGIAGNNAYPDYSDPYTGNSNYQEESDAAFRAGATQSMGPGGMPGGGGNAAPNPDLPYGEDQDSKKWSSFMAVTDGPDPIDPLQQEHEKKLQKEREKLQQEQMERQQQMRQDPYMQEQHRQQQQQQMPYPPPGQPQQQMPYSPPQSPQQPSMNDFSSQQGQPTESVSDENARSRSAVQARMAAEMAKFQQQDNNPMNDRDSNNPYNPQDPPDWNQRSEGSGMPFGQPGVDFARRPPPSQGDPHGPWAPDPLPTDFQENSPGYWSKYMSVSDGPDPVEPAKNYDRRKAEWEAENARWEAAQERAQAEQRAREEAARLEAERKDREKEEAERREVEAEERRKAQMSVDNEPLAWEQHQARARARNEMAEQMAQAKLYEQMEKARQHTLEREKERERTVARYRDLRSRLEADRRAQEEQEARTEAHARIEADERDRWNKGKVESENEEGFDVDEKTNLETANIEAEIRAKAEAEERAKADEAARAWEQAVARARAKIMAEEMMKGNLSKDKARSGKDKQTETAKLSNVTLSNTDSARGRVEEKTSQNVSATAKVEKLAKVADKIKSQSRSNAEDIKDSRVAESHHRALLEAHLAVDEKEKSKITSGKNVTGASHPTNEESTKTPSNSPGVSPKKRKYGYGAGAFNILEAIKSPRKTVNGGDKELTMAELAKKYRELDKQASQDSAENLSEKAEEEPTAPPPREQNYASRVEESRKRALLASIKALSTSKGSNMFVTRTDENSRKMAELEDVEQAKKGERLDLSSRRQYYASRIEEMRNRALASAKKAAPSVSVSKPTENVPDPEIQDQKRLYFTNRIEESRRRALLANIEAATAASDSTIFVKGNIANTREKAAAEVDEDEVERLAEKPLTELQEYFANRIAASRKRELLAQIEEASVEDVAATPSQKADDDKETPVANEAFFGKGAPKVNLKSSPPSSLEEFKKIFSYNPKKANGSLTMETDKTSIKGNRTDQATGDLNKRPRVDSKTEGSVELKPLKHGSSKAAPMSILGRVQNGEAKVNGEAKINGRIEAPSKPNAKISDPSRIEAEKRNGVIQAHGKKELNGKKAATEKSFVEAGANATVQVKLEKQQNRNGESPK